MYETYYGFREKPFNLTPDPKYLYLSQRHGEAFAHLEFARRERGGFVVITGEVGTGKTTLARYFLSHLGESTATAVVLYPAVTAAELLRSILEDLHIAAAGDSLKDLVDALHRFLLEARRADREVVLLIDEAQDLSPEVLEQIRLISNLETDTEKLLTIVLMGQSELHEMLSRRELRQLAQRVTARYHMSPLDRQETEEYIRHRIEVAGGGGKVTFTAAALSAVHRLAGGIPRLINLICDRALLGGYVQGVRSIEAGMARRAAREVRGDGLPRRAGRNATVLATGLVLATAIVGALLLRGAPVAPVAPPTPQLEPRRASPGALLEPYLLSLSREASLAGSLEQVEALWGQTPLERTSFRTHMGHLKRLDLPVVLEMFHPSRRDTCFLALLEIRSDQALVSAGGKPLRLPLTEIDRLWTRQALFLWRDAEALASRADDAHLETWARGTLAQLGYLDDDIALTDAVRAFQRDSDLTVDGIIGNQTLMALYSSIDDPRPRLQPKRRSADASRPESSGGPS